MKKLIVVIGLVVLTGVAVLHSQSVVVGSQTQSVTADIKLPAAVGSALLSQAVIATGDVRVLGTNIVITSTMMVVVPAAQFSQYAVGLPSGYDITNLAPTSFILTNNEISMKSVFTKTVTQ